MRNFICFATLLLLLNGCASKTDDLISQQFQSHKTDYKNLQKTEKVQLYDHNVTKALLTATYLYTRDHTLKKDTRDEVFVVGVYLEEDHLNRLEGAYTLSLDGNQPTEIMPLSKKSDYLKEIPFITEWNSYYLIRFPHTSKKTFKLVFESLRYGKGEMHFAKRAKYVESQKAF